MRPNPNWHACRCIHLRHMHHGHELCINFALFPSQLLSSGPIAFLQDSVLEWDLENGFVRGNGSTVLPLLHRDDFIYSSAVFYQHVSSKTMHHVYTGGFCTQCRQGNPCNSAPVIWDLCSSEAAWFVLGGLRWMDWIEILWHADSWWFIIIHDDSWWFMVLIHDDSWWIMMTHGDLRWFMVIHDDMMIHGSKILDFVYASKG